ncbi:MAG: hypothetical protein LBK18_04845 [Prevotellaceae bacterium]|jgi:hypothetical protein|nr:hypothetical protein [Prevotellaceae bacterium]
MKKNSSNRKKDSSNLKKDGSIHKKDGSNLKKDGGKHKKNGDFKADFAFLKFVFEKKQLPDWAILLAVCLAAYIGLKIFYPYPCSFNDSGSYVKAAIEDIFYVYRPFGYSYFLRVLHAVCESIHFVFIVQLLLFFLSTAFVIFTIKYFYHPKSKRLWFMFLLLISANLPFLIICNTILSDALFACQIYLLLGLFMFIVKKKSWIALFLFEMVLFSSMHVRYSAIIFPFFFIPFFIMLKGYYMKYISIIASVIVFAIFYSQTENSMYNRVKIKQFSTGFDGWNYLNNALYVVPHIDMSEIDMKDRNLKNLHSFIISNKDSISNQIKHGHIGAGFVWDPQGVLKQYLFRTMQSTNSQYLSTFVKLGSNQYKKYATYLIAHYPVEFAKYYYFPNMLSAFYPSGLGMIGYQGDTAKHGEILEYYHIDKDTKTAAKIDILSRPIFLKAVQIWEIIIWGALLFLGVWAIVRRKRIAFSNQDKIIFWGIFSFAVIYYASTIFASAIEFRYWISMYFIKLAIMYLLLNFLASPKIAEK